ncbi:MAG: hypothetical protein LBH69_03810, partial [Methanomassiliicoccaceae archaeon]|nr:hypothetical protein [Methanomassiliicoccaceae archaeon]
MIFAAAFAAAANTSDNGTDRGVISSGDPGDGEPKYKWFTSPIITDEFMLYTADDLAGFANVVNGDPNAPEQFSFSGGIVALGADIDLSVHYGESYNDGKGWVPIGYITTKFEGTFDGNGKTISGLYINDPDRNYAGLFGFAGSCEIKNIDLEDVSIIGKEYVGGIAGDLRYGSAENCNISGSVGGTDWVGGIAGTSFGSITGCSSSGSVGGTDWVGGIVGLNNGGSVTGSHSSSAINITANNITGSYYAGGIAGAIYGDIGYCYSTGNINVSGSDHSSVGGIAGAISENGSNVTYCYSTGDITGIKLVGGIVGNAGYSNISDCRSTGSITGTAWVGGIAGVAGGETKDCYSTGNITGNSDDNGNVGGIAGEMTGGAVKYSYSTGNVTGGGAVGGIAGRCIGSIEYCYSTGDVTGRSGLYGDVGGIAGAITGNAVLYCYSTGDVNGYANNVGGIAGTVAGNSVVGWCYSVGNVSGLTNVGGIAGLIQSDSFASTCAALNPTVQGDSYVGRIAGLKYGEQANASGKAFAGMKVNGTITGPAGESVTAVQVINDGSIGGYFPTIDGWTIVNGKLPGIGAAVNMPAHLQVLAVTFSVTGGNGTLTATAGGASISSGTAVDDGKTV